MIRRPLAAMVGIVAAAMGGDFAIASVAAPADLGASPTARAARGSMSSGSMSVGQLDAWARRRRRARNTHRRKRGGR